MPFFALWTGNRCCRFCRCRGVEHKVTIGKAATANKEAIPPFFLTADPNDILGTVQAMVVGQNRRFRVKIGNSHRWDIGCNPKKNDGRNV